MVGLGLFAVAYPRVAGEPAPGGVLALGLVTAAVLALHGAGIVLVHRADRCLNLAQVQIGAAAATAFAMLVQGRTLLRGVEAVCAPCIGEPGAGLLAFNFVVAALACLALAAGIGRVVHAVVVRRLKASPPVVVTVATAFVVQLLIGIQDRLDDLLTTEEQRQQGALGGAVSPPVDLTLAVGGTTLHIADLLLIVAAPAVLVGLAIWLRRTDAGRDLRAASSDPERAATLGIDASRAAGRAWAIAGLLSGLAGLLAVVSLGTGAVGEGALAAGPLVRILAVAVAARLVSLPMIGLAALVFGQLDQAVTWVSDTATPLDGAMVVIVGALLLLQRRTRRGGDRGDEETWGAVRAPNPMPVVLRNLPEVRRAVRVVIGLVIAVAVALPWLASGAQVGLASVAAVTAVVGLSTLIVTGWAGQVSLGQLAFAAVGAAVAGATHLPLPLAMPAGALTGALVAAAVGTPALRLRGLEMAAVTLALALSTSAVLLNPQSLGSVVGDVGGDGLPFVDLSDPRPAWYVTIMLVGVSAVGVSRFRRSRLGRALVAARDDEAAAQSFGIDVVRARLAGFALAGALAGAAGAMLAHLQGAVAAEAFTPAVGVTAFTTTVLGGLGTTTGPLLGFALIGFLAIFAVPGGVVALLTGAGGLALLLVAPGGLVQLLVAARDSGLRRVARRRRLDVPGLTVGMAEGRLAIAPPRVAADGSLVASYRLKDQWGLPPSRHEGIDA